MAEPSAGAARWAEAQSVLDRAPTESAEQRLRRWRQLRLLVIVAVVLVSVAVAVVVFVVVRGRPSHTRADLPTWQMVLGVIIAAAGLIFQCYGVVVLLRRNRRLRAWRSPMAVLTSAQRKEVRDQVRGKAPIDPDRVPLARDLAERLIAQSIVVVTNAGLAIAFVGQWVLSPSYWRLGMTIAYGLLLGISWPFVQRDVHRARRFLAEHPDPRT